MAATFRISICAAIAIVLALGCSGGPSADDPGYARPTVFVPTAAPTPTPTLVPVPTPTASLDVDYLDTCDLHLKQAMLALPGPWGGHHAYDSLINQVQNQNSSCAAPQWQPALSAKIVRLDQILTTDVTPALQDSIGRTGRGEVRLSFDPAYLPGDGYQHWYYDVDDRLWLSGDIVADTAQAFAAVEDLPLAVVARLQKGCWDELRAAMLAHSTHEALTPAIAAKIVQSQQRKYSCQASLWDPEPTDAGELPVYHGVALPAGISNGVGQSANGSFRMDFRIPASAVPVHVVYISPSLHSEPSATTGYIGVK